LLKKKIFTPGPTQVHPEVLTAVVSNFTYHRSSDFRVFYKNLVAKLKKIFFSSGYLNVLTASGTGSMEAAVVNFCTKDRSILFLNQGRFGARWGAICKTYGINSDDITVPDGETVTIDLLSRIDLNKYSAVFLTQSETSTATLTNIKLLSSFIKSNSDALVIVDSISSIGSIEFRMDEWEIDAAVSASQKGFMTPPGLAVIAYSQKARDVMISNSIPRYYFDLQKELDAQKTFLTSWTPAVGIMYGLDKACDIMLNEGMENRWKRVNKIAEYFRNECKKSGFGIFSKNPANSLTAFTLPDGIPTGKLVNLLREKYGIQIANGQDEMKDKIARVSHMGDIDLKSTSDLMEIIKSEYKYLV